MKSEWVKSESVRANAGEANGEWRRPDSKHERPKIRPVAAYYGVWLRLGRNGRLTAANPRARIPRRFGAAAVPTMLLLHALRLSRIRKQGVLVLGKEFGKMKKTHFIHPNHDERFTCTDCQDPAPFGAAVFGDLAVPARTSRAVPAQRGHGPCPHGHGAVQTLHSRGLSKAPLPLPLASLFRHRVARLTISDAGAIRAGRNCNGASYRICDARHYPAGVTGGSPFGKPAFQFPPSGNHTQRQFPTTTPGTGPVPRSKRPCIPNMKCPFCHPVFRGSGRV
jgi:hypothetical protein